MRTDQGQRADRDCELTAVNEDEALPGSGADTLASGGLAMPQVCVAPPAGWVLLLARSGTRPLLAARQGALAARRPWSRRLVGRQRLHSACHTVAAPLVSVTACSERPALPTHTPSVKRSVKPTHRLSRKSLMVPVFTVANPRAPGRGATARGMTMPDTSLCTWPSAPVPR